MEKWTLGGRIGAPGALPNYNAPVLRLVAFFFACMVMLSVLRAVLGSVPVIGWILRMPLIGFWVVAIGLSLALSKLGSEALDRRKRASLLRQLGAVETPHNMGKLGSLFVAQGRNRRALEYLDIAVEGEPDVAEWRYRRGCALLALGRLEPALQDLSRCLEIDDEHAYGAARMVQASCLVKLGEHEAALLSLETLERYHGASPESSYRRGLALKALDRREEAQAALQEVGKLVSSSARYQKRSGAVWAWRARWARLG